ncbi:hypothetical protein [Otariodibacter oris]|uniref:Uncharacterized protein n=1 Tax=Otariodibacter oris TaxID=1032623 RepID=A0A420XEX4_9PAST|nr:hypothetical protein [Otariodibacter oris]QGM81370.1 hypothetical protein A6A10_08075 [Otariodibacter oris]RKR70818.1 hypothetical protein DES31_1828 [Otariodibacter oris]
MIERLSQPLITINPSVFDNFHCALISAEQEQEYGRFSLADIRDLFGSSHFLFKDENEDYTSVLRNILVTFENPFIEITQFSKTAFLFYNSDLTKLKERAIALSYLFNQKKLFIFPQAEKQATSIRLQQEKPLQYTEKVKDFEQFEPFVNKFFEMSNPREMLDISYKENRQFINSSPIFFKGALANMGERIDEILSNIVNDEYKV